MFDSAGLQRFLSVVLYVNAAFAVVLATEFFGFLPDFPLLSAASISVLAVSALVFLLGQTPLFPWLCGLPIIWRLFPNIDGEYEFEISSNWSIINARLEGRNLEDSTDGEAVLFKRIGKARITTRLMQINVSLIMDDNYLKSETFSCSFIRYRDGRQPVLFYIYDSHVTVPKNTDSQRHLGAARVAVPMQRRPKVLEGTYWTDRNWHLGLNTAGRVLMRRL